MIWTQEIDERRIDKGRGLKRLRDDDPDFKVFKAEINERIEKYRQTVLDFRKGSNASEVGIDYFLYRYQALSELLSWLDSEIDLGAKEAKRKAGV